MTPLDCALRKGFRSTAKYLQLHGGVPAIRLADSYSQLATIKTKKDTTFRDNTSEQENIEQILSRRKYHDKRCSYVFGGEELSFSSVEGTQAKDKNSLEGQQITTQNGNITGKDKKINEKDESDCSPISGTHFDGLIKNFEFEENPCPQPLEEKVGTSNNKFENDLNNPILYKETDIKREHNSKDFYSNTASSQNVLTAAQNRNISEDNSEIVTACEYSVEKQAQVVISKSSKENNDFKEKSATEASMLPLPLLFELEKPAVEENCDVAVNIADQCSELLEPNCSNSEEGPNEINHAQNKNQLQNCVNKKNDFDENISFEHKTKVKNDKINLEIESGSDIRENLNKDNQIGNTIQNAEKPINYIHEFTEDEITEDMQKKVMKSLVETSEIDCPLYNSERSLNDIIKIEKNIVFDNIKPVSQSEIRKDIQKETTRIIPKIGNIEHTEGEKQEDFEINDSLLNYIETGKTDKERNYNLLPKTNKSQDNGKLQNHVNDNRELGEVVFSPNIHRSFNVLTENTRITETEKPRMPDVSIKEISSSKEIKSISHVTIQDKIRSKIPTASLKNYLSNSDKYLDKKVTKNECEEPVKPNFPSLHLQYDNKLFKEPFRSKYNISGPPKTSVSSNNERDSLTDLDDVCHNKNRTKRFIKKRSKHRETRSAGSECESSNLLNSGSEPSPRNIEIGKWKYTSEKGVNMKSVTQSIQRNIRR